MDCLNDLPGHQPRDGELPPIRWLRKLPVRFKWLRVGLAVRGGPSPGGVPRCSRSKVLFGVQKLPRKRGEPWTYRTLWLAISRGDRPDRLDFIPNGAIDIKRLLAGATLAEAEIGRDHQWRTRRPRHRRRRAAA